MSHISSAVPSVLIVVPTYQEVTNILSLLNQIYDATPDVHVLFVDDGSRDGTVEAIKAYPEFGQKVFIVERTHKMGLGSAYIAGFKWGLMSSQKYPFICQMDADLSHEPKYLALMLELAQNSDLVIGSRYIQGGGVENWSFVRKLISQFGSWYARRILSLRIKDLTGGFNLWRVSALAQINLDAVRSEGYSFQIELKYRANQKKFCILEYPILFKDRVADQSKMSLKICIEAFLRVIQMKLSRL